MNGTLDLSIQELEFLINTLFHVIDRRLTEHAAMLREGRKDEASLVYATITWQRELREKLMDNQARKIAKRDGSEFPF